MKNIKCPNCGENILERTNKCTNCGCIFNEADIQNVPSKRNYKKIVIAVFHVICIAIFVTVVMMAANRPEGIQANAQKHVEELEDRVGDVDVLALVCFSRIGYGDKDVSFKYLIEYNQNDKTDFAVYYDEFEGEKKSYYVGNGYDGGESSDENQIPFNNLQALSAHKDYLEYLIGEGKQKEISEEDARKHNAEGIIVLNIK